MEDESTKQPEEEDVEGHVRPHQGPEEPGKHFERGESAEEEDEVEGHVRPHTGPEKHFEPEKHF